jgi:tRNA modification GTPase
VIRVSGPNAVAAVEPHFVSADSRPLSAQAPRLLQFGRWMDSGEAVDEVLCVRFEAPHSFTGEDVVEVHAHGGSFHLQAMLQGLLRSTRLARPGEFTQRAFVNGKMDLTRAEAVADLIRSGSELSRKSASRQLLGGLFELVEGMRQQLADLAAQAEASLDFPEEEGQLLPKGLWLQKLQALRGSMQALLRSARPGRLLNQGMRVVLLGAPNAGKSSLMNALLESRRSIVHAAAGTTRDFIEEPMQLFGMPLLLTDTAGLRESKDEVEREGVRRSRERAQVADLLLLVLDSSQALQKSELKVLESCEGDFLVLGNKADLPQAWSEADCGIPKEKFLRISCVSGEGISALKEKIFMLGSEGKSAEMLQSAALTSSRHEEAMRRAESGVGHAIETLQRADLSAEFLSGDLRGALDALGDIVGKTTREDVLHEIFAKFCIGK